MNNLEHSQPADLPPEKYFLRWRGQEHGPHTLAAINRMLANHEVGLLTEICVENRWVTLREFLTKQVQSRRVEPPPAALRSRSNIGVASQPPPSAKAERHKFEGLSHFINRKSAIIIGMVCFCLIAVIAVPRIAGLVRYTLERNDEQMRTRTKEAWLQIRKLDGEMISEIKDSETYLRLSGRYVQLDLDHADPSLITWTEEYVLALEALGKVLQPMEKELADSNSASQEAFGFFRVVGTVLGGLANNGQSLGDNMRLGEASGSLIGALTTSVINDSNSQTILKKYEPVLRVCEAKLKDIMAAKEVLRKSLSEKYNLPLM